MRLNLPVTQQAYELAEGATLMSTTDTAGRLLYANDAFVEASGFSREELLGQPHNLVRHPDMPREAFADMWATLKKGLPWTALVKNRRKNGDHYWVRANAVPLIRQGRAVGYMSVRTRPTAREVADAEVLYGQFREGTAGARRFHEGLVLRTGWRALLDLPRTVSVRARLRLTLGTMWMGMAAALVSWVPADTGASLPLLLALTAAMALAGCQVLEQQLARPMERLLQSMLDVATGANRMPISTDRTDEIGTSLRVVSQLAQMFQWLVNDVSQQAGAVKDGAAEIVAGNSDLSARTEQAAASVEQTAASMEQMTATVKNNASAAEEARELARVTSDVAQAGGHAVDQVVSRMQDISDSSRRIADIINVIDDIAFQTNILALNAAVEAARAGEQGRGFAVVAGEVRSLAQRSATAAREIKTLISDSNDKVASGGALVADAGQTMQGILTQVQRVSALIHQMSHANQEQSTGIAQVGDAVVHLDQITQQNAALVQQSAAASDSLRTRAERLAEAIRVFQ